MRGPSGCSRAQCDQIGDVPIFLDPVLGSGIRLVWSEPGEAVPGEDPAHAVNEGKHKEDGEDGRDGGSRAQCDESGNVPDYVPD